MTFQQDYQVVKYVFKYDWYQLFHKVEISLISRINKRISTLMTITWFNERLMLFTCWDVLYTNVDVTAILTC